MTIDDWLESARADADRRGLAALKPLLATLADATRALREAGWDADSRQQVADTDAAEPGAGQPGDASSPPADGAAR